MSVLSTSPRLLPFLLAAAWIGAFLAAISYAAAQRDAARSVHEALQDCHRLAREIGTLQAVPATVVPASRDASDLAPLLERLAERTSLGSKSVVSIEPEPAVPVPKSSFRLQSTNVTLQPLPLPELITLLYAIVEQEPALVPTAISLSPNTATETGQTRWSCQLVLTCLIDTSITALPSPPSRSLR
jgi:hypothetical protein